MAARVAMTLACLMLSTVSQAQTGLCSNKKVMTTVILVITFIKLDVNKRKLLYKCASFNVLNGKFLAKCSSIIKFFLSIHPKMPHRNYWGKDDSPYIGALNSELHGPLKGLKPNFTLSVDVSSKQPL